MNDKQYEQRSRINVDIEKEVHEGVQKHVPWGTLKHLVNAMLKDFVSLCEKYDSKLVIGAILTEQMTLKDFLNKHYAEKEEEDG